MQFCTKCGARIAEGERFCGNCGTPVVPAQAEGTISNQQYQNNVVPMPQKNTTFETQKIKEFFLEILTVCKNIFLKPISTICEVNEKIHNETAFILGGILAIIFGLMNMWSVKIVVSSIEKSMGSFMGIKLFSFDNIGYGRIFISTLFIFLFLIVILFAANYIAGKYIMHSEVDAMNVLKVIVCSLIPFIAAIIVQNVFMLISVPLGLAIMYFGISFSLIILYKGLQHVLKVSEDSAAYIIPISIAIAILIYIACVNSAMRSMLTSGINNILH